LRFDYNKKGSKPDNFPHLELFIVGALAITAESLNLAGEITHHQRCISYPLIKEKGPKHKI